MLDKESTNASHSGTKARRSERSQAQLWQIIKDMPAWVQVCRLDGTIELVNRAASRISGYPASELIGQAWPYPWLECPQGGSLPQVKGVPVWPYGESSHQPGGRASRV